MEINQRVWFANDSNRTLLKYLINNDIPFEQGIPHSVLEIFESNPHWKNIEEILRESGQRGRTETIFSSSELDEAQWLTMRSCWHNGYPQPDTDASYKKITYNDKNYCNFCGTGLVQQGPFRIVKAPNWRNRNFFMLNWVFDEIFVSEKAKNLLQASDLTGFEFMEVLNKKGTEEIENTYQLVIPTILSKGLISETPAIREKNLCPHCSINKYFPSGRGMQHFKKDIFENSPDIVKTEEVFGGGRAASRIIIISQKMYRFICNHHIGKNLCFEPIKLVNSTGDGLRAQEDR